MGVRVRLEVDYREGEDPFFRHYPIIQRTHRKPLYAFLSRLEVYCGGSTTLQDVFESYQRLDQSQADQLCEACRPLLECMWYNAGFSTAYQPDQYELFKQENPDLPSDLTEEAFQEMVEAGKTRWQPIDDVLKTVRFILSALRQGPVELIEGFFAPEHTIPDFEALEEDLKFMMQQSYTTVRLTFS